MATRLIRDIKKDRWLYYMALPGIVFFIVYKYLPMYGLIISFQDYMPYLGISGSNWVGLKHFERFVTDSLFWQLLRNTLVLAVYNLVFFFPLPIVIALLLNEIRRERYKRFVQTVIYIPHFISWPVIAGLSFVLLATTDGVVNQYLASLDAERIGFLTSNEWFRTLITSQVIWKETGWGTIIFLAALSGIDPQLYEAARIDGANRWQQLRNVTLPAIRTTIVLLLILRLGSFMDSGFEQVFLMVGSGNREVGEVFDTYVYTSGLANGQFSYSTAVGLFKSVISLVLVVTANYAAKKMGQEGVY